MEKENGTCSLKDKLNFVKQFSISEGTKILRLRRIGVYDLITIRLVDVF